MSKDTIKIKKNNWNVKKCHKNSLKVIGYGKKLQINLYFQMNERTFLGCTNYLKHWPERP